MKTSGVIAFVSLEIYPTTAGGVGILVHHTIRFLLSAGYEVVLLLDIQPHEFERFSQVDRMSFDNGSNLHVYNVSDLCAGAEFPATAVPHGEMLRSARIATALEQLAPRHEIELVEFYDYCGPAYYFLGSAQPNPPAVAVRLHNTIELIARKIRSARDSERLIQFAAERAALGGADLVLSSGQKFFDWEIAPLYPEIDTDRLQISPPIHAPVGTISYSPLANDVAFYGRLSTFKGLDRFIKGAVMALRSQEFADWLGRFLIMGPEETVASAYSLEEMKGFIPPEFQHRFEFTGRVDHPTLMRRLENVAFACFANRMESFCYAAHELHTAGVPLILSDTATFLDHFVEGETALFFDSTGKGLSERMIELAQDRALRMKLSAAGKARAPLYLVDYYAQHLAAARRIRAQREAVEVEPTVLILDNGDRRALGKTLKALEAFEMTPKHMILRLDAEGGFRFAGQRWTLSRPGGEPVNHALTQAPEAVVLIRSGDRLSEEWLSRAAGLLGRRADVGAVFGWRRRGAQILMGGSGLLPEAAGRFEPGLRCLIRLNSREMLQDALMTRPDDCEASMLLALRAEKHLLLTLPCVSCDTSDAIDLPQPSFSRLLDFDFDRMNRDYLADRSSRFEEQRDEGEYPERELLDRSLQEPGLVALRAVPQAEVGGGDGTEVLLLRYFPEAGDQLAPWSMLKLEGGWSLRNEAGGPVGGALRSETGTAIGYVRGSGAVDALISPWAGQLEVIFQGRKKLIDLKSEQVTALRIFFDDQGIWARPVIARDGTALHTAGLGLSNVPELFTQTGACDTLLLCRSRRDMEHWPLQEMLAVRRVIADATLFTRTGGGSPLQVLLEKSGAKRLVFSSQLAPTPEIGLVLQAVPADLEIGLMLCGSPEAQDEEQTLLAYLAKWYALLAPYMNRLRCIGGPGGVLELFAAGGARTFHLASARPMQPKALEQNCAADAPVSLALLGSDQPPRNLMHLFNAVLIAMHRGLKVGTIYLPQSYRDDLLILDHFNLDVTLEFFAETTGLGFVGEGTKRIALCAYPQEYFPPQLAEVTALGWLPLAGAVSTFGRAPERLAAALSEPYWENSAFLAQKLFEIDKAYPELLTLYAGFVRQEYERAQEILTSYLTQTDMEANGELAGKGVRK